MELNQIGHCSVDKSYTNQFLYFKYCATFRCIVNLAFCILNLVSLSNVYVLLVLSFSPGAACHSVVTRIGSKSSYRKKTLAAHARLYNAQN